MKKTALITGIHGFLGGALHQHLLKNYPSITVYGISRQLSKAKNIFTCDLIHIDIVKKILKKTKPDVIFHFAGGRSDGLEKMLQDNVTVTAMLLQAVSEIKALNPRIIIPGSAAEYGRPTTKSLITEESPATPQSDYGFAKLLQTKLAIMDGPKGLDVMVMRIFNILGKGTSIHLAAGQFAKQIVELEKQKTSATITTHDLSGKRDFVDVDDICRAAICLMQKGKAGEIYHVCSAKAVVMRDLLKKMISLSKRPSLKIKERRDKFSNSFDVVGSFAKIHRATGWRPTVSLTASLKQTLESYRNPEA